MPDAPPATTEPTATTPPASPAPVPAPTTVPDSAAGLAAVQSAIDNAVAAERARLEAEAADAAEGARIEGLEGAERIKAEADRATAAAAAVAAEAARSKGEANATVAAVMAGCPTELLGSVVRLIDIDPTDTVDTLKGKFEANPLFAAAVTAATTADGTPPPATAPSGTIPATRPTGTPASVTGIEAGRAKAQARHEATASRDKFAHFKPIGA